MYQHSCGCRKYIFIDACIEHIKYTVDIFSIRCSQTIWIIGVMNESQKYGSKEQVRDVCEALHACYVGEHLTCAS